jgi:hypothetical protein
MAKDSKPNLFKKLVEASQVEAGQVETPSPRPLSKRQDPSWITRTYFLEKTTDIEIEGELYSLRRDGIEMDKSDLINAALKAWVAWRRGEVEAEDAMERISPRQKS